MERYEAYKDSGIEWIGEIPERWTVTRVKNNASIVAGATPKSGVEEFWDGDIPWIGPADFSDDAHYVSVGRRSITAAGLNSCGTELVPQGSVIVTNRAPIGRIALAANELCTNQGCKSVICREGLHPEYLYWQLVCMTEPLQSFGQGTTFIELSISDLASFSVSQPSFAEQQAIADFLDEKTAEIDGIVSETERSIELLREYRKSVISEAVTKGLDPDAPMKDSGVEWIGEIPEGWFVSRVKYVAQAFGRIGFRGYKAEDLVDEGNGALTLSPGNLAGDTLSLHRKTYLSWEKYEESPEIKVAEGDVLFTKTGSSYGKSAFVRELRGCATVNPQLLVFKNIKGMSKYFYYVTCSRWFVDQVEQAVVGGTIPTIAQEKIGNMYVVWPPEDCQMQVVDYLDTKTAEIDALIADKEKQVDLLKEYRKSLISEAVTGKFKVPGVS